MTHVYTQENLHTTALRVVRRRRLHARRGARLRGWNLKVAGDGAVSLVVLMQERADPQTEEVVLYTPAAPQPPMEDRHADPDPG